MNRTRDRAAPPLLMSKIGHLYRAIRRDCTTIFREKEFPLDLDQIPVLLIVYYKQEVSQQEIGANLQRDKGSVNRTIGFLLSKGYVKVSPDATDKRKTNVSLTTAGKTVARQADATIDAFNTVLSSALTAQEQQQFYTLVQKLIEKETSTPDTFLL